MKQKTLFRGIATALATPMTSSGAIDYDAYGRLIDWQIESGVAGLVTCGTTGEASTMTAEEHRQTIAFAVKRAAGRVPVIAGTGANCTEKAVELTRFACTVGADACLVVTPYYNKATQRGLIAHYTAIADASDRLVILYNVPSRTGCNLLPETCAALASASAHRRRKGGKRKPLADRIAVSQGSGVVWTSIPATTIRSCRSSPWAARAASPCSPMCCPGRRFGCASCSSPAMCAALRRSSAVCCPSSTRCFPRSIPFRSRRRWQKWATAPTRCVCRSPRWRKDAGPSF